MPRKYKRVAATEEEGEGGSATAIATSASSEWGARRRAPDAATLPLHRLVWEARAEALTALLSSESHELERQDPSGRTPLRLAVLLNHLPCVHALLDAGADARLPDADGWSPVHDATATGRMRMRVCLRVCG